MCEGERNGELWDGTQQWAGGREGLCVVLDVCIEREDVQAIEKLQHAYGYYLGRRGGQR
jgi:hypothetical protein